MKVLLLTKQTPWCYLVQEEITARFSEVTILEGAASDRLPEEAHQWQGDLILSFCCPWVLPKSVLDKARWAVNFHPAPPAHPGFAPYSWALYQEDPIYGVTAHKMAPRVDTGAIIEVKRFPIYQSDSVYRLQQRSMRWLFALMIKTLDQSKLFGSFDYEEQWERKPRTKAEFEELRKLTPDMGDAEIAKRTRACYYPGFAGAMFMEDEG